VTSSIRKFWQRLEPCAGLYVHPDDAPVFEAHEGRHTFNRDFPPPAFIGDVDNAPIVILMAHGGYDPQVTPSEFPEEADRIEYLQWLKGERTDAPRNLSTYYTQNAAFRWIRDGQAVIVNAVAYRSQKLAHEPQNLKLAKLLPSMRVHQQWLRDDVLPNGSRCVVAHHRRLWNSSLPSEILPKNVHISTNPISRNLSRDLIARLDAWLLQLRG
jgi:hypothetical protein